MALAMEKWVALIITIPTIVTAVVAGTISLMTYFESRNNGLEIVQTKVQVEKVHEIVNSQRTEMLAEIATLKRIITEIQLGSSR